MAAEAVMEDDMEDMYSDAAIQDASNPDLLNPNKNGKGVNTVIPALDSAQDDKMDTSKLPGLDGSASMNSGIALPVAVSTQEGTLQSSYGEKATVKANETATEHPIADGASSQDATAVMDSKTDLNHHLAEDSSTLRNAIDDGVVSPTGNSKDATSGQNISHMNTHPYPEGAQVSEPGAKGDTEWELDSSPYESSSDDSSDLSSSDDGEDDYELLDPAEQARRLMAEDGNSDDEDPAKDTNGGRIKSHNEKIEEPVEMPDIVITPDMAIEELGFVENIVDNIALIKAKTSGEFQVLEAQSLLCLQDRTVIGVVSETLGRVHQPLYCVRFRSQESITEAGIGKDTVIFYVPQHSTFVFTQALRNVKGSDASNIYDEEIAEDEIEFSDDEAEAEYKRGRKAQRQARRGGRGGPATDPRRSRDGGDDNPRINYDDGPQEDHYTPLSRPTNLHEMMHSNTRSPANSSRGNRGHRSNRGEYGHSRGRGHYSNPGDSFNGASGGRGGRSYPPPANPLPPMQPIGFNPAFAFPAYGGYGSYMPAPDPSYHNGPHAAPYAWGAPHPGANQQQQHQQARHPQFPAGVAINPWFLQGQTPNSGNHQN